MEERYLLELRGVNRRISSEFYLRGINLALRPGEVQALVGRNASGKSTLFSTINARFKCSQHCAARSIPWLENTS